MPERDPLLLGPARTGERAKPGPRGRDKVQGPGAGRQAQRIGPRMQRITAALDAERLRLRTDPDALEPETILVLEIAGDVASFATAMVKVSGLEFLGEQALEQLDPDDDFRAVNQRGQLKKYPRQLFLIATDAVAWRELLKLWESFKRGEAMPRGLTPFRDLFGQLLDIREWSDRDRLERAGAAEAWRRDLAGLGDQLIPFEAELWLRRDAPRRQSIVAAFDRELRAVGGELADQCILEDIDYHGVMGRAPASRLIQAAASGSVAWLHTEGVRLFHPTGQIVAPVRDGEERVDTPQPATTLPSGATRVALLDGLPVVGHVALTGRVVVDDPDDWSATVSVRDRNHGTVMASLVIHGDLGRPDASMAEPLYVRPILLPDPAAWFANPPEMIPVGSLPVDLIHRAVARLFQGADPVAPATRVIVLAVGDPSQQFDRFISPLARLVDWLAWRYEVLCLVSGGNHTADLEVPADVDLANGAEVQDETIDAIRRTALSRRLLAPAESINALTIGAAHDDRSSTPAPAGLIDPLIDSDLPSVISPTASGVNRAIKPDLLLPGGRQLVRAEPRDGARTSGCRWPCRVALPGCALRHPASPARSTATSTRRVPAARPPSPVTQRARCFAALTLCVSELAGFPILISTGS